MLENNQKILLKLNGLATLRENIADNGGLKEAWLAFKNHTSHSTRPVLVKDEYDGLEDDQLFFYAYAHVSHSRSFITSHEARNLPS